MSEMTFRQYDPAIGRFNVIDEMSEDAFDYTPYRFAFNNPIYFSDPTGLWEEINGGYSTNDPDEIARLLGHINNRGNTDTSTKGLMNFIKGDIAYQKEFDGGLPLSTAYVKNGKITDHSIHRMKNEIAYYEGNTDYLYTREDYEMRNNILAGGRDPISTELLRRESIGWYQPITAKNWVSYIGYSDSARMLAWASFAESMDGPSMELGSLVRVKPRLGSISKINGASLRLSKTLGLSSAGELQNIRNISFKEFHMKFSGKYKGKFKGRGSYMGHMARDWKAIKAGL